MADAEVDVIVCVADELPELRTLLDVLKGLGIEKVRGRPVMSGGEVAVASSSSSPPRIPPLHADQQLDRQKRDEMNVQDVSDCMSRQSEKPSMQLEITVREAHTRSVDQGAMVGVHVETERRGQQP